MQYVFPTSVFLAPRSLMGLGGGGGVGSRVGGRFFWWPRLLLTFACSWKEPSTLLPLLRSAGDSPKQFNRRAGWGEHRCGAHVAPQRSAENKGHVQLVGYCTAWLAVNVWPPPPPLPLFFTFLCFGKRKRFPGNLSPGTHLCTCWIVCS